VASLLWTLISDTSGRSVWQSQTAHLMTQEAKTGRVFQDPIIPVKGMPPMS
jgi:hypothetical protein